MIKNILCLIAIAGTLCLFNACGVLPSGNRFSVTVETASGKIEGKEGLRSLYFKGIPYAQPPVGDLRWQPPAKKSPWQETLKAHSFSKACPQVQPVYIEEKIEWDEDCLCLNIYRPKQDLKDLPVMVFIHGGAFIEGTATLPSLDGEWLAQKKKVVLVTVNYRLGVLGFLYSPEAGIKGNYGIQDQVHALEWIQANIEAFGGNPANVTVYGESAGGISIGLLLGLRPELFHKAIIQSGFIRANADNMSTDNASRLGKRLIEKIGCEGAGDVASCLREKSDDEVLSVGSIPFELSGGDNYGPVLDGEFITDVPLSLIMNGAGKETPLIMGVNANEGAFFAIALGLGTEDDYKDMVQEKYPDIADGVLDQYPATDYERPDQAAAAVMGDIVFACPTRKALKTLSAANTSLYQYYFTYPPAATRELGVGAFHGAELSYLFHTFTDTTDRLKAEQVSQNITELWTSFAYDGVPSAGETTWQPYTSDARRYLVIDSDLSAGTDLRKKQCDFWDCCEHYFP